MHLTRKRGSNPATLLLTVGFSISLTSILIGISTVSSILDALSDVKSEAPIYLTMENTGLDLALAIYLFSIANCLVITNYWIITRRRDMAIRKAFGWSNRNLVEMIVAEMARLLATSFCGSIVLLVLLNRWNSAMFTVHLTPLFLISTLVVLLLTLTLSVSIPTIRILKIRPAEVVA